MELSLVPIICQLVRLGSYSTHTKISNAVNVILRIVKYLGRIVERLKWPGCTLHRSLNVNHLLWFPVIKECIYSSKLSTQVKNSSTDDTAFNFQDSNNYSSIHLSKASYEHRSSHLRLNFSLQHVADLGTIDLSNLWLWKLRENKMTSPMI